MQYCYTKNQTISLAGFQSPCCRYLVMVPPVLSLLCLYYGICREHGHGVSLSVDSVDDVQSVVDAIQCPARCCSPLH